jgi:hypothetical protein
MDQHENGYSGSGSDYLMLKQFIQIFYDIMYGSALGLHYIGNSD